MGAAEVLKRVVEQVWVYVYWAKYHHPQSCQYPRLRFGIEKLNLADLPGTEVSHDWRYYWIHSFKFNLHKPINWHFSDKDLRTQWPQKYYSRINYRPGNPFGDVRINWELNRLQFLPAMAASDEALAKSIINDWLDKNPYLRGPAYLSSMEVALRWFSIYWAVCLFKQPMDESMVPKVVGLAAGSGKFIERHLSTHSSAGNHLIVEAVGLFWIGRALRHHQLGSYWTQMARKILFSQIMRQINSDGTNKEQSFWYLGFVLDALFHYLLLEDKAHIPDMVWRRIEKALEYVDEMILPDGSYPDYGDRDDGVVFRLSGQPIEPPFSGLLNLGAWLFDRPAWYRKAPEAEERLNFWMGGQRPENIKAFVQAQPVSLANPQIKTYPEGGITLMRWANGRLIFRHSRLGLENTYGHGHADALAILFFWNSVPVFIDLGSGQYNGDPAIRDFFRSTIAHNTVEVGGTNQAKILGPFMWEDSYQTRLEETGNDPICFAQACHDGYQKNYSLIHTRKIEWLNVHRLAIYDSFSESPAMPIKGAIHLGHCRKVYQQQNSVEVAFYDFSVLLTFHEDYKIRILCGSKDPFMGWRSLGYGQWNPTHSIIFSTRLKSRPQYHITLDIFDKAPADEAPS
jgi:hypothetical protein